MPARIPYRFYLVWQAWLEEEWNNPSRSDHYLMQIAACLQETTVEKQKIVWKEKAEQNEASDKVLQWQIDKARILASMGGLTNG